MRRKFYWRVRLDVALAPVAALVRREVTCGEEDLEQRGRRFSSTPEGRGGRKPGHWELLTPDKLRAYREQNKVSRARLAQMLGVSSTSVQNWETGTVASMKIQQRLAELLAAGPSAILPLPPRKAPSLWDADELAFTYVKKT